MHAKGFKFRKGENTDFPSRNKKRSFLVKQNGSLFLEIGI
jgi:hypothetical protein